MSKKRSIPLEKDYSIVSILMTLMKYRSKLSAKDLSGLARAVCRPAKKDNLRKALGNLMNHWGESSAKDKKKLLKQAVDAANPSQTNELIAHALMIVKNYLEEFSMSDLSDLVRTLRHLAKEKYGENSDPPPWFMVFLYFLAIRVGNEFDSES